MKLGKTFFISLQKLFSFWRKSNFRILDFQISWRHQMPKHKTRNTFHWITWEVNTVCQWNLASLCHVTKEKIFQKNCPKTATCKTSSRPFYVYNCFKHNHCWKMKLLKQAINITYVLAKLSKFVQISTNALRFLLTEDSLKIKKDLELVSRPCFSYNFLIKKFLL